MAHSRYVMQLVVDKDVFAYFLRPQIQSEQAARESAAKALRNILGVTLQALYRAEELNLKAFGTKKIWTSVYLFTGVPTTQHNRASVFFIAMTDNKARILVMRKKWRDCNLYRCTKIQIE